jgi:hypothetical protein
MDSQLRTDSVVTLPRCRSPWWLAASLMFVLFFQGCHSSGIELTAGPVVPFLGVIYNGEEPRQSQLLYFSAVGAVLNLGALIVGLVVVPNTLPRLRRVILSRRFQIAAVLVAIQFNLVLVPGAGAVDVWMTVVFGPIAWICDRMDDWMPVPEVRRPLVLAIVARGYFVICWLSSYALLCGVLVVAERYLGFDRRRWWQFRLRALLAVTFVVGTGLGILLRVWPPD